MRHFPVALVLTLFLISPSGRHAQASLAPTSVSLSLGYSNELGPEGNSYTPVPSVSALWPFVSHVSVFSAMSYLQERSVQNRALHSSGYPYPQTESGTLRSHFVPVAVGIRLSLGSETRSHGLFVEAGPAVYLASLDSGEERVLAGFQAGTGLRFRTFGASHAELGMRFYRTAGADAPEDPWSSTPDHESVSAYVLHATIGLSP